MSIVSEMKKGVAKKKTEHGEVTAASSILIRHGYFGTPEKETRKQDGMVIRLYTWYDTPEGDLTLVTGPGLEGELVVLNGPGVYETNPVGQPLSGRRPKDADTIEYIEYRPRLADGSRPRVRVPVPSGLVEACNTCHDGRMVLRGDQPSKEAKSRLRAKQRAQREEEKADRAAKRAAAAKKRADAAADRAADHAGIQDRADKRAAAAKKKKQATYPVLVESRAELNALLPIVILVGQSEENIYFRKLPTGMGAKDYYAKEGSQAWDILAKLPHGVEIRSLVKPKKEKEPGQTIGYLRAREVIEIPKLMEARELAQSKGKAPFRAPHHTISAKAIKDELDRAQGGMLYLDQLEEFPGRVIESLNESLRHYPYVLIAFRRGPDTASASIPIYRNLEILGAPGASSDRDLLYGQVAPAKKKAAPKKKKTVASARRKAKPSAQANQQAIMEAIRAAIGGLDARL